MIKFIFLYIFCINFLYIFLFVFYMFANDLSYFCITITISTLSTIITFSSFTYIKNLYTQILNKVKYCHKEVQTNAKIMINSGTQTEQYNNGDINYISYNEIKYMTLPKIEDSLENLMLLAKDQLIIELTPSNYKWNLEN